MSSPGYFYPDQQTTPQQRMAQALMQPKPFNPQQAYSGISDAGSSLAQAVAMNRIAQDQKWNAQGISPVNVTPQQVGGGAGAWLQRNLFGFGGS